jgi:8-oxo-dGTP pyrophosphatase MutT (NUDIX family)
MVEKIRESLMRDLPGWEAQKTLSPIKTDSYREARADAMEAGVNILLYPNASRELELLYIRRPSANPNDKHSGQISFPGGRRENHDKDIVDTALRETEEEIGVPAHEMKILGQLSPLYVYVSNYYVQPIVSYLDYKPELILQKTEVDYVIAERLEFLKSEDALGYTDYRIRNIVMSNMPHYKLQNHILWGATAMITAELVDIVREL